MSGRHVFEVVYLAVWTVIIGTYVGWWAYSRAQRFIRKTRS